MTSLQKYRSRRNKASYYSLSIDPTAPTGTPIPAEELEEIIASLETTVPVADVPDQKADVDAHVNQPLGIVQEIALEYMRLRDERAANTGTAGPVTLSPEHHSRTRDTTDDTREKAIFAVQYQKLLSQSAYVEDVWKYMEEIGYFDHAEDEGHSPDVRREENSVIRRRDTARLPSDDFVQGSSRDTRPLQRGNCSDCSM
ncbi:hypothetical protein BD413DRAFT_641810 [Trametes elegans]|nr:hypothetical protein BD413DRAFT_641810 [Trametes elegans]